MALKIKREGNRLVIVNDGKKSVRTFVTEAQAIAAHEKLVADHDAELEQRRQNRRTAPKDLRHPELEELIFDDPANPESYAPFADWLEMHGDPRSVLMALQLALTRDGRTPELEAAISRELTSNRAYLLGPLAVHQKHGVFDWQFGFIYRAALDHVELGSSGDVLEQLLAHPSGRFLASITAGHYEKLETAHPAIEVLVRNTPRSLRSLHVLGERELDLERLWPQAPRLQRLSVVHSNVHSLALPALEFLRLVDVLPRSLRAIAAAQWPVLEELHLVGSRIDLDDVMPILGRSDLGRLEKLELTGVTDVGRLVRELPETPIAAQLERLDLSRNDMTDADAIELARHRDKFPHLERFSAFESRLTARGVAALRGFATDVSAYPDSRPRTP